MFVHSPVYGASVVLGPTQEAVYRFVLGVTSDGRRPTFPLRDIAAATGKPVSSVHEALGRLRALGLIGLATRMGRTGGHRLWRAVVAPTGQRALNAARHSLAIARVMKRWRTRFLLATQDDRSGVVRDGLWSDTDPAPASTGVKPQPAPGSFDDAMRRHGFTPWWRVANEAPDVCGHCGERWPCSHGHTTGEDACAHAFVEVAV